MNFKSLFLVVVLTLAIAQMCNSQCLTLNLIKNPGLEEYLCCPTNVGMIDCATYWHQNISGGSTSEYLNVCGIDSLVFPNSLPFFQHSYFGDGYAGICTFTYNPSFPEIDYREYINGALSEPLIAGQCYHCEFWVEFWNWGNQVPYCGNDALGIFFSDTVPMITDTEPMAMFWPSQINNPSGRILTDTGNWVKVSGTFNADGGEQFFTVGNFKQISEIHCTYYGTPQFD